jgi:hypothetical protein
MSTKFRSNVLTKLLDKIFDDKCLYAKSGSVQRGPGIMCGFYIFFIIISLIYSLIITQKLTKFGFTREHILVQNAIDIVISIFSVIFIYHMCYICRGFVGFIILFIINICILMLRVHIFKNPIIMKELVEYGY